MNWLKVKIYVSRDGLEPLCGRLYCLGVGGVQIEDAADFEEFIETGRPHWDFIDESLEPLRSAPTSVTAYLTDDEAGVQQLALIRESVEAMRILDKNGAFGELRVEVDGRDDSEWMDIWKQYYKPFAVGDRLLVRPEWDDTAVPEGKVVVTMNPGHLFGTGTHDSTRMCMERLEALVSTGDRVLDLGAGSGILSILALILGAERAVAVDIDAGVTKVAYENLALNGINRRRYKVFVGNVLEDEELAGKIGQKYDIVVANIVADVIIPLAPAAYKYTRHGGVFIASGIIDHRADEVSAAIIAAGFDITAVHESGGWYCFVCKK